MQRILVSTTNVYIFLSESPYIETLDEVYESRILYHQYFVNSDLK